MDTDSRAVVEAHLHSLGTEECASLVADLWRERGYEVTRDGTSITAVDGERATTIHVGTQETEPAPDVLIRRGRGGGDTAARILDVEALADRLWYAVDRSTARDLCRRHMGGAPSELRLPLSMRVRRHLSEPPLRVVGVVILCTLLVLVAGAAALGLPGTGETAPSVGPELSPRYPPTMTERPPRQAHPPGVDSRGIADRNALALAHQRTVDDRPLTVWINVTSVVLDDGRWRRQAVDTDVTTDGKRYLIRITEEPRDNSQPAWTLYHDGRRSLARAGTDENASYREYPTGERAVRRHVAIPTPSRIAAQLVSKYLSTPTTDVERVTQRDGDSVYRIEGAGQPRSAQLDQVRNYTVTATVTPEGLVTDLNASYTVVRNGTEFHASYRVTYGRLDTTTVTAPEWYERRVVSRERDGGE